LVLPRFPLFFGTSKISPYFLVLPRFPLIFWYFQDFPLFFGTSKIFLKGTSII
jgi:hypothetical protein